MSTMVLLLFFLLSLVAVNADNYSDCSTSLSTLERALYETGDNVHQMNRIFFPPSTRPSRFIRVTYSFKGDNSTNCAVSYIWAIGIILFFQPPSVFTSNSLYFNYPNNDLIHLRLTLPNECRPLVSSAGCNDKCCCTNSTDDILSILTQQVCIYNYM